MKNLTEAEKKAIYEEMKAKEQAEERKTENQREQYKNLVLETTEKNARKLKRLSRLIGKIKKAVYSDYGAVLDLKEEIYGIKEQFSHTFTTEQYSIKLGKRTVDNFDDTVHAGIEKVKSYIASLTKGEAQEIKKVMDLLLKKDKNGNLKASRVLELKKLAQEINNKDLSDGVKIIEEAFKPKTTRKFIEIYEKDEDGKMINIPLAISTVE